MCKILTVFLLLICSNHLFAVKVKGIIKDPEGEPLSFASVVVKGQATGTMANASGEFSLDLAANTSYELVFQFIGYKTVSHIVELKQSDITLNVVMQEQAIKLGEITVGKSKEDPAYAIMRKAIAKSKIHDKQVESYSADTYIKNTLVVNKYPRLLKREMDKNNIKVGVPFISEAVVNLKFSQPNKRVTKVLAKKLSMDSFDLSGAYYLMNFYNLPTSLDLVSPLSVKSFSYYRFEYLGYFEDKGQIVNKIQIIPKSYGPGVCRGTIYIVDDLWCIHSIDAETVNQSFNIKLKQLYSPVKNVWVPTSQIIDFWGKPFGFDFKAKLQVNPKYRELKINEKYVAEVKIVDEKEVPKRRAKDLSLTQKELSLKELNKIAKQMEKEEKSAKKKEEREVVVIDSVSNDSLYKKRSVEYWEEMRSIPLSKEEMKGYQIGDSIRVREEIKKDTTGTLKPKSPIKKILFGDSVPLTKEKGNVFRLNYTSPLLPFFGINYNIVEGIFTESKVGLEKNKLFSKEKPWYGKWDNKLRYSFGMERFMATSALSLKRKSNELLLGGGSFTQTFDEKQEIPAYANSILNLFNINLTQLYLKQGGYLGYSYSKSNAFTLSTKVEYAQRSMLYNLSPLRLSIGNREPTPNSPANIELGDAGFSRHNAVIWSNTVTYRPGAKYRIYNGKKNFIGSDWPELSLNYRKGLYDVDYDFVSLGLKQDLKTGSGEKLKYYAEAGTFLNDRKVYLMDMKHVNSINFTDAASGVFSFYRLLNTNLPLQISPDNYYRYSTQGGYLKFHAVNEFRKLLVTQIPIARFTGLKEDLFINYLKTPAKKNYLEVGYGIDGIFKLLRFEVITALEKGQKPRWGWQIGVTF
jgi:hypothetical protein